MWTGVMRLQQGRCSWRRYPERAAELGLCMERARVFIVGEIGIKAPTCVISASDFLPKFRVQHPNPTTLQAANFSLRRTAQFLA